MYTSSLSCSEGEKRSALLVLVRHGETTANATNILQGQCDFPLTDKGISEAVALGRALKNKNWVHVVSSDLSRARDTAQIILSQRENDKDESDDDGIHLFSLTERLRESSFGLRDGLPIGTTIPEAIRIVAEQKGIPESELVDNSETHAQVVLRANHFLLDLVRMLDESDESPPAAAGLTPTTIAQQQRNVLCVAHGGFIRIFLTALVQNLPGHAPKIKNTGVSGILLKWEAGNSGSSLVCEASSDDMSRINCTPHLDGAAAVLSSGGGGAAAGGGGAEGEGGGSAAASTAASCATTTALTSSSSSNATNSSRPNNAADVIEDYFPWII